MLGNIVDGIVLGCIITLGGLGISYVLLLQNYFNFTGGTYFTLGAFIAFAFSRIIPMGELPFVTFGPGLLLSLLLSMILLAIIMTAVDKLLFRPLRLRNAPFMFFYLTAFGMLFVIRSIIYLVWGAGTQNFVSGLPHIYRLPGGINITADKIFVVLATIILVALIYYFQYNTRLGKAMLATADDERLAAITGIKIKNIHTTVTVIAGLVTAMGGVFYGIAVQMRPLMGFNLLMAMFFAVICGGHGAILGTLGAGIIIGVLQEFGTVVVQIGLDAGNIPVEMSGYKEVFAFIFLIIILLTKPYGIFEGTILDR